MKYLSDRGRVCSSPKNLQRPGLFCTSALVQPSGVPTAGAVSLYNDTYRQWRSANGEGGDYLVLSDLKKVPLDSPSKFITG